MRGGTTCVSPLQFRIGDTSIRCECGAHRPERLFHGGASNPAFPGLLTGRKWYPEKLVVNKLSWWQLICSFL